MIFTQCAIGGSVFGEHDDGADGAGGGASGSPKSQAPAAAAAAGDEEDGGGGRGVISRTSRLAGLFRVASSSPTQQRAEGGNHSKQGTGPAAGGRKKRRANGCLDPRIVSGAWRSMPEPERSRVEDFLRVLAVCHTALVDGGPEPLPAAATATTSGQSADLVYQVSSPDESALVTFAADCGLVFCGREGQRVLVRDTAAPAAAAPLSFEMVAAFEFTSTRKRHSVVVRAPSGAALVLCKGADDVVFERLAKSEANAEVSAATDSCLDRFGAVGLRTLCIAKRRACCCMTHGMLDRDSFITRSILAVVTLCC